MERVELTKELVRPSIDSWLVSDVLHLERMRQIDFLSATAAHDLQTLLWNFVRPGLGGRRQLTDSDLSMRKLCYLYSFCWISVSRRTGDFMRHLGDSSQLFL